MAKSRQKATSSGDGAYLKVSGVAEIQEAFGLMGKDAKKFLNKILRKNMKPLQKAVVAAAPVGTGRGEHGSIKKNVKIRAYKRSRKGFGIQVFIRGTSRGTDPYWSGMVERGTVTIKGATRIRARHYMLKVFKHMGPQLRDNTIRDMRKGIDDWIKAHKVN